MRWPFPDTSVSEPEAKATSKGVFIMNKTLKPKYIYLMWLTGDERFKIGVSKKPEKRILSLQKSIPYKLVLVHAFMSNNAHKDEKLIHQLFKECKLRGEWFLLNRSQVAWFCSLRDFSKINPKHQSSLFDQGVIVL